MRRLILVLATMGVAVLLASGAALGITGGTIRLSVGTESSEFIRAALAEGLGGLRNG